jgi:alpha-N-acetylglucosaminidase
VKIHVLPHQLRCVLLACAGLAASFPAIADDAVRAVLERSLGPRAAAIHLELKPGDGAEWYQVGAHGGTLQVEGSSRVALAHGSYAYLGSIGAASVSWEGTRSVLPDTYADRSAVPVRTPFLHRAYLNTCTYGYTTPFWDWARWEKEIDWMALHGIDMPLAMEGQEAIWQDLWRELGVADTDLADYFSGPAFTPWQRMGNIEGYRAPLAQPWIEGKRELQRRILQRMRELDMKPVLPAFAGYVPKAFAQAHPEARIYRMRAWEGFHETYWLDPADPLFARIAERFIALYTENYGAGQYYLADAFNEMLPPISHDGSDVAAATYGDSTANSDAARAKAVPPALRDERLAAYGQAIYQSIAKANPQATWVMQGWLFGADREFWTPDAIAAFLKRVPDDRMLVLDIGNDRYPGTWKQSGAFNGKQWIYGYVHNYGGSNPVYGDFGFYQQDIQQVLADSGHGQLTGFGVFPEGLHNNSVVYEYLYSLAWGGDQQPWSQWIENYSRSRYGHSDPRLMAAWDDLRASIYSTRYWSPRWWNKRAGAYLLFKRPTVAVTGFDDVPGDPVRLRAAIQALLEIAPDYRDAPLFAHDLVEYTRHYLDLQVDVLLKQAVAAYQRDDLAAGDAARDKAFVLVRGLDALVAGQQETLASWTGQAQAAANGDAALARYYVANARAQVSVWGGQGNLADYASKAWQGMYEGFYLQRWSRFLDAYRASRVAGRAWDDAAFSAELATWERQWADSGEVAPSRAAPADVAASVRMLLQREAAP